MRAPAFLRHFARARAGMAAVEFALIAPMMIVLLFTSIELITALQTNRRVENTAASLADVVSRDTEISNAELAGLWSAARPLMFPDDVTGLDIRLTSISINGAGQGRVVWSEQCGVTALGTCSGSTYSDLADGSVVPDSELPAQNRPNTSLIRVEMAFEYRPLIGFFRLDGDRNMSREAAPFELRHTSYRRSRLTDPIPRVP